MSKRILPLKKIREEVVVGYNRDPEGWRVFVGKDRENYISSIFIHKSKMWIIKEFAINPYRFIGCGVGTRFRNEFKQEDYQFGLRPLTTQQEDELECGNPSIMKDILSKNPVSEDECNGSSLVLEGPIVTSDKPIVISNEQEKLDLMLRKSLNSMIRKKYPEFMKLYI